MIDVVARYVELLCHEINNPLTIVYGQTALLKAQLDRALGEGGLMRERLGRLEDSTVRVVALVRELREALRVVEDEAPEVIALTDLLAQARLFNERWCHVRGVRIVSHPSVEGPLVCVRPVRMRGILWPLTGRILQAASAEVRAELEPEHLTVTITGPAEVASVGPDHTLEAWAALLAQDRIELAAYAQDSHSGYRLRFPRVD